MKRCLALFLCACSSAPIVDAHPAAIEQRIVARAIVEASSGTADVAAGSIARVVSIEVDEGDRVERGDVLATLDGDGLDAPSSIRAPIGGVIVARHADPGDDVGRGEGALFEIADVDHVRLRFELEDADAARVEHGATIRITTREGVLLAQSAVDRLSARMEPRRIGAGVEPPHLIRAGWAELSASEQLPLGRELDAVISLPAHRAATSVPRAAIALQNGHTSVLVPSTFGDRAIDVSLGAADAERVEILEGLHPGERIRARID